MNNPRLLGGVAGDVFAALDVHLLQDRGGDLRGELGLVAQRLLGGVAALADEVALVSDPGALLLEDLVLDAEIEDRAELRDALVVHDVELALGERRGDLVLHHLDLGAVAHDLALGGLDLVLAADVDADRGEELQRAAARGRLGVAEHDADLLADLVRENADAVRLADDGGEAAHGLRHQAGLRADGGVTHLAVELGLGREGGDGVEDDHVDRVRADERLHDVERVLAGVGLGDEEVVEVDADDAGVLRVECVLDVDEGGEAAALLGLGDHAETEGGLAGGFRAVDLDDAALGEAADPEGEVDGKRAGAERLDLHLGIATEAHDRALAELLRDGGERELDILVARGGGGYDGGAGFGGSGFGHWVGWVNRWEKGRLCGQRATPPRRGKPGLAAKWCKRGCRLFNMPAVYHPGGTSAVPGLGALRRDRTTTLRRSGFTPRCCAPDRGIKPLLRPKHPLA